YGCKLGPNDGLSAKSEPGRLGLDSCRFGVAFSVRSGCPRARQTANSSACYAWALRLQICAASVRCGACVASGVRGRRDPQPGLQVKTDLGRAIVTTAAPWDLGPTMNPKIAWITMGLAVLLGVATSTTALAAFDCKDGAITIGFARAKTGGFAFFDVAG